MTHRAGADAATTHDDLAGVTRALSWIFLVGFFFLSSTARGIYSSRGVNPSNRFEVLCAVSAVIFVWYWLTEQCRPYKASFPLDIAFFASSLWFILLPYYLWHHERWRGLLKVAILGTAFVLSYVWSVALHYLLVWTSEGA